MGPPGRGKVDPSRAKQGSVGPVCSPLDGGMPAPMRHDPVVVPGSKAGGLFFPTMYSRCTHMREAQWTISFGQPLGRPTRPAAKAVGPPVLLFPTLSLRLTIFSPPRSTTQQPIPVPLNFPHPAAWPTFSSSSIPSSGMAPLLLASKVYERKHSRGWGVSCTLC